MSEQLRRHISILRCLPKASMPISTADVAKRMKQEGFRNSKRTIERDLALLIELFPQAVICEESQGDTGRTNLWGITESKPVLPETLLDNSELALALTLLKQQAYSRLPLRIFNLLKPLWDQASKNIENNRNTNQWLTISRFLPNPLRPVSPYINQYVQKTIEDALINSDVLALTVKTLDGIKNYQRLIPIRLLQREEIMLLLAENTEANNEDDSIFTIPMHRIISAKTALAYDDISEIDPDMAESYALKLGDKITISFYAIKSLAESLFERPLGEEQSIIPCQEKPNWYLITTTVQESPLLTNWLTRRTQNGEIEFTTLNL